MECDKFTKSGFRKIDGAKALIWRRVGVIDSVETGVFNFSNELAVGKFATVKVHPF